jgi:hypothetical protein
MYFHIVALNARLAGSETIGIFCITLSSRTIQYFSFVSYHETKAFQESLGPTTLLLYYLHF